ncbi:hypothetical protein GF336_04150 [Candidatus Woesearchaeota archaeon]|nr:hypothetical protein [Candidatus Woesearchaeota archaeon]
MNYKVKSAITVSVLIAFMLSVGIMINNFESEITGAAIAPVCECSEDADCDDDDRCTEDICLYPESCEASLCVHDKIESCTQ